MRRAVNRILSAAVLLPVLLFSVAGTSFATWRCRSDGIARLSCCCPDRSAIKTASDGDQETRSIAAASGPECCEVEQHDIDKAPSDLARARPAALVPAVVALSVGELAPAPPASPTILVLQPEREHPSAGRLLLLRKQSFLI
jgi:hypothetical protein